MFENLTTIAVAATVALILYLHVKSAIAYCREVRNSREQRILLYGLIGAVALLVGSCAAIERATGASPDSTPSSFVIRLSLGIVCSVGYLAFAWWFTVRPETRQRSRMVAGKTCSICNRALSPKRLHRPVMNGQEHPSKSHWFHRCACGEGTLFDADGHATRTVDRSLSQPPAG